MLGHGVAEMGDALVPWLYQYALARDPSPGEKAILAEFANDDNPVATEDLLWSIFMLPEFQIIR